MTVTRVTVFNLTPVERRLSLYGRRVSNYRSLWRKIASDVARAERFWFSSRGEGRWPQLSPKYAAWKARNFPGRPILVRTEELKKSLTQSTRLLSRSEFDVAILSSDVEYAKFHQTGTSKMPARPPLIPTPRVREIAGRNFQDHAKYRRGFLG